MLNFIKSNWKTITTITFSALFLFYIGVSLVIGHQVQNAVSAAQEISPGDAVTSLITILNSDDAPLKERNRAIWALGQLGNPQALDTLNALSGKEDCDHSSELCQYELTKAIKLCQGNLNITAIIWRHGSLSKT